MELCIIMNLCKRLKFMTSYKKLNGIYMIGPAHTDGQQRVNTQCGEQ